MYRSKGARPYLRLFAAYFKANMAMAMEYRANFLMQAFGMALNNAAFIVFWRVLIDKAGLLGGYGFEDVMFLWALASAGFGLGHVLFGNVRAIGRIIVQGELDVYLLQPKNVLLNLVMARSVASAWGDLAYGIILYALVRGIEPLAFLAFLGFVCVAAVLYVSVFAMAESLSFWLGNAKGVSNLVFELLLSFTLYPETIFGPGVRWLLYSLVPAGFVVFIPLKAMRGEGPVLAAASLGASALYAALAFAFFKRGLKRYESGNLVQARL